MTPERRKLLLWISATLIIGILIGSVTTEMINHHRHKRTRHVDQMGKGNHARTILKAERIFMAIEADSAQRQMMELMIEKTTARINKIGRGNRKAKNNAIDSLYVKVRLLLRDDQKEKFDKLFSGKRLHSLRKVGYATWSANEHDYWISL